MDWISTAPPGEHDSFPGLDDEDFPRPLSNIEAAIAESLDAVNHDKIVEI
jgi:hypothetical protein